MAISFIFGLMLTESTVYQLKKANFSENGAKEIELTLHGGRNHGEYNDVGLVAIYDNLFPLKQNHF